MRKTLQKLLIVTTTLTFSCNTFSAFAMFGGDNDNKKTANVKPIDEIIKNIIVNDLKNDLKYACCKASSASGTKNQKIEITDGVLKTIKMNMVNDMTDDKKNNVISKYNDLCLQLKTSKKELYEAKDNVKLGTIEIASDEERIRDIKKSIEENKKMNAEIEEAKIKKEKKKEELENYRKKYEEATWKVKQDIEKIKHFMKNTDDSYYILSDAKNDLQKSIDKFKNTISQYKDDLQKSMDKLKNTISQCEDYLPKLDDAVIYKYHCKNMTTCVIKILNIINDLKAMTGAKDHNWENKILELASELTNLVNLSHMYDDSDNEGDLYKLVQNFKKSLDEYKEANKDMKKKKVKLSEVTQNANSSIIEIEKIQAELNKDIEDKEKLEELTYEKQHELIDIHVDTNAIVENEKNIKMYEKQLNKAEQEYDQNQKKLKKCNEMVEDCKKKIENLTATLKDHESLMSYLKIQIPSIENKEMKKEEEIKKDAK